MPPKSIASYFKPASGAAAGTPAARNRTTPSAAARKAAMDAKDKDNKDNDEPPAKRAKVAATTTAGRAKKGAGTFLSLNSVEKWKSCGPHGPHTSQL